MTSIFARFLCLFGRHRRSKGQAYEQDFTLVSVCRHCGIPMAKVRGAWQVVDRRER